MQSAVPVPAPGAGQTFVQLPQCSGLDGLTHAPAQLSDVEPLHPSPHVPAVHVACPVPASGAWQTLSQLPQWLGNVGLTHVPLQSSVVGAVHPADPSPPSLPVTSVPASLGLSVEALSVALSPRASSPASPQ